MDNISSMRAFRDNGDLVHTNMGTDVFPSTNWTNYAELDNNTEPRAAEDEYVGQDDASLAYHIYSPATDHTNVVGTPNFTRTDVGTCASRVINSASISALPVDPTDLFYNKHAPFHDTVNPKTTFDIVNLGAWCSQEGHNLISMDQLPW
jgi:hypothetical protein